MAKRFDIQEWIAKQKLAEQDDFTPDLEYDVIALFTFVISWFM